ncbi:MAG: hypothetical protein CO028_03935 [Candidatus Levybacteria bacterium CG_4_9_14_0_2_um_filter_35_21]|nr:MAG: hypothetical protein COW87_02950 [Candidatus Levybacteria bacterium CG22_combo_CG10-13_8_21_14_all_35_11]PJC54152.1 MAG: hypothetical protein CO028_03935 [Candidatus Levybacteria bacterium CG_4_9_14_0_2_um_filter_35_21]
MTETLGKPLESHIKHAQYDLLYDGINLAEKINGQGQKLIIPRRFLFGTQELTEYSQLKRKQIIEDLEIKGLNYLLENPVIVLACEFDKGIELAIVDGHHRVRYAPIFHIFDIPCLITDANILSSIINKEKGKHLDPGEFCMQIQQNAANTLKSFADRITDFKSPDFLFGPSSVTDLKQYFPSFQ